MKEPVEEKDETIETIEGAQCDEIPDSSLWEDSGGTFWADVRDRDFWEGIPEPPRLLRCIGWPRGKPLHARSHAARRRQKVSPIALGLVLAVTLVLAPPGGGSARGARTPMNGSASTRAATEAAVSLSVKLLN